jgi:hypothetical protein
MLAKDRISIFFLKLQDRIKRSFLTLTQVLNVTFLFVTDKNKLERSSLESLSNMGYSLGPYSHNLIFFVTYDDSNRLKCYITLGQKGLSNKNTLAYSAHS